MQEKNVVVIGGGPGTNTVLLGLKRYTSQLTALVSTFDASTRRQRHADGIESHPGDNVRSSLLALGADPPTTYIMERLFAYRFAGTLDKGSLTFGNLLLSALTDITGGTDLALRAAAKVLNVQGEVLPVTLEECPLIAELNDGQEVTVTTPAELRETSAGVGLRNVRLSFPAEAVDAAVQAVNDADIIVLGPADLYFGLLAPLQMAGLRDALAESSAVKIFICNLMGQPNTTGAWPASRFIRAILNHLGTQTPLDCVIVNSAPLPPDMLEARADEGAYPVHFDLDECLSLGLNVIVRPVASSEALLHDPEKLARTILFLGGGRSTRKVEKRRAPATTPLNEALAPTAGILVPRGAES